MQDSETVKQKISHIIEDKALLLVFFSGFYSSKGAYRHLETSIVIWRKSSYGYVISLSRSIFASNFFTFYQYRVWFVTEPHRWSAAAMYQATRIFASNLKEKMAQRFYNLVLLPRARDDIQEFKRLNFHIFQALRKALFKPAAFMKGILLPLCEVGFYWSRLHNSQDTMKDFMVPVNFYGFFLLILRCYFHKRNTFLMMKI